MFWKYSLLLGECESLAKDHLDWVCFEHVLGIICACFWQQLAYVNTALSPVTLTHFPKSFFFWDFYCRWIRISCGFDLDILWILISFWNVLVFSLYLDLLYFGDIQQHAYVNSRSSAVAFTHILNIFKWIYFLRWKIGTTNCWLRQRHMKPKILNM